VKKKFIDKIYLVLLLTAIVSSSYAMLRDMASKNCISCTDTDVELVEDNSTSDTDVEQIDESLIEDVSSFRFYQFATPFNAYFYLQNAYEIYLGRNTSPP